MTRPQTRRFHDYEVFGLRIRSELELPELIEAAAHGEPDVTIRVGSLPAGCPSDAGMHPLENGAVLVVEDIARFQIRAGSEILVEPRRDAAERNIRLYLLGSAIGLAVHQRGLLALHANAIEIDGKAVLFMGASGEGKSTLAAWMQDHGFRIIADDVCVIRFDASGTPFASAGLPRLRLWKEMIEATGRRPEDYQRSYAGDDAWEKYDVPLAADRQVTGSRSIAALYLLRRGNGLDIVRLQGLAAAEALFANTYRGGYIPTAGNPQSHYNACLDLVRRTPIFGLSRSWEIPRLQEELRQVLAHVRALIADAAGARAERNTKRNVECDPGS